MTAQSSSIKRIFSTVRISASLWTAIALIAVPVTLHFDSLFHSAQSVAIIFFLFLVLLFAIKKLLNWKTNQSEPSEKYQRLFPFCSASLCAAVWSVYGIIFYPGFISWDFYVQWHEMSGRVPFSDWHPVFHTCFIWLVTRIWNSPAMVSLVQILCMSFAVGIAVRALLSVNAHRYIVLLAVLFYAFFPLNGFYAIFLTKDILYSAAFLWFNVLLLLFVRQKKKETGKIFYLQLIISLLFVALMRHNGIIPVFGTLSALFIFFRQLRAKSVLLSLVTIGLVLLFKGPAYHWLQVESNGKNVLKATVPIQHIGAVLSHGGKIQPEEKKFLAEILPLSYWKKAYQAHSCFPLLFGKNEQGVHVLNWDFFKKEENYRNFLKVWLKIVIRNPVAVVQHYMQATELVWKIHVPYYIYVIPDEGLEEKDIHAGYTPSPPLWEKTGKTGLRLLHLITNTSTGWLLHRSPLYFWISLFFISLTCIRSHKKDILLLATPILLQAATVAAFPVTQETRYMFPIILAFPFFAAVFFSPEFNPSSSLQEEN